LTEAAIAEADGALVAFLMAEYGRDTSRPPMSREEIGKLMATLRRFRAQFRDDVPDEAKRKDDPTPA
jgi:hypothetical protein